VLRAARTAGAGVCTHGSRPSELEANGTTKLPIGGGGNHEGHTTCGGEVFGWTNRAGHESTCSSLSLA